jgi:hypothetical protein
MDRMRLVVHGVVLAALAGVWSASAVGQVTTGGEMNAKDAWEQRVLGKWRPAEEVVPTSDVSRVAQKWQPHRRTTTAKPPAGDENEPEQIPTPAPKSTAEPALRPVPEGPVFEEPVLEGPEDTLLAKPRRRGQRYMADDLGLADFGGPAAEACDDCGESCERDGWCERCGGGCFHSLSRYFTLFAGVQGFKGPVDLGQNGNFGFHEGLNFGAPLGDPWHAGYQIGIQGVHSNFSGSSVDSRTDSNGRDQTFITAGFFHRALEGGLQGGVVFDYVHDNYYEQADLKQIRNETSWNFSPEHELGYWGAYGINLERFQLTDHRVTILQPNDIFAGFYRRHFSAGGQGRLWAGATGLGDAIVGADLSIPLGTSWSLENNFTYMIPKQGHGVDALAKEVWSVSIQLVWYPGRQSRCIFQNPYTPLLPVADNTTFLYRRSAN